MLKKIKNVTAILMVLCMLCITGCEKNETAVLEETEAVEVPEVPSVSEEEILAAEQQLQDLEEQYQELLTEAEVYQGINFYMGSDNIEEIVQSQILQSYEENTVLAVEIKTLLMDSLGVEVPDGFKSAGDIASDNYYAYIEESVVDGITSQIASGAVQGILSNGITGAVDSYRSDGTLSSALEGAKNSIVDGVAAGIQDAPLEMAKSLAEDKLGAIGSAIVDATTSGQSTGTDGTSGQLLQTLSDSATETSGKLGEYLSKETLSSTDIAELMYQFSQYGNIIDTICSYGGNVNYSWDENYTKMENLYKQFLYNETMIKDLSECNTAEYTNTIDFSFDLETSADTKPISREKLGDAEYYAEVMQRVENLQSENAAIQSQLDEAEEVFAPLEEYRAQVAAIQEECSGILEYYVENFKLQLDTEGLEEMDEINQIHSEIGDISKYLPFGFGLGINLLTTMAIYNNDAYYKDMVNTGVEISNAFQTVTVDTNTQIKELKAQLEFYEQLVAEQESKTTELKNMFLLEYLENGQPINFDETILCTEKQMYILACALDYTVTLYAALTGGSGTTELQNQYREIVGIIDPDRTGEIADCVSAEELAPYLLPIAQAGTAGIKKMDNVVIDGPTMEFRFVRLYDRQTGCGGVKMSYCSKDDEMLHVYSDRGTEFVYSMGTPIYANGYYLYKNMVLNNETSESGVYADGQVLVDEALWMAQMVYDKELQNEVFLHFQTLSEQGHGTIPAQ